MMPDAAVAEAIEDGFNFHPLIKEYADELVDMTPGEDGYPLPTIRYLNVYIVEREYGGPEEGGWWYDVGTPQGVSIVCNTISAFEMQDLLEFLAARYPDRGSRSSMMPQDEDYQVRIERHPPKEWPDPRPHYE
jgi:hypothetical protein